ncbi:hypothetical protein niasHT_031877 [Heterodera trifolii]|uniref:Uncharacterized protein n=1 Tax=Heterodera trifolii TaxID=157864 RepID=A0ABD2I5R5_9BILA
MLIQIHRLNASISLFLALCLNAILILLVVKRSPKEMKVYKRILLQTALVDIALSVLSFLSQDVGISTNGWTLVLSVSQFSDYLSFSAQFGKLLINSWLMVQFFSVFGLCVQFVYRFLVLNRRNWRDGTGQTELARRNWPETELAPDGTGQTELARRN